LGLPLRPAHAQIVLGDTTLDVVSDGSLTLPRGFVFDGMPQDALAPIAEKYGLTGEIITPPCNLTLLRREGRVVLFDAGSGPDFAPDAGVLVTSLDALGVSPDDVTDVIFTHAHPDHLWGLLDDFDEPLFANAAYQMGETEFDYWMAPDTVDTIDEVRTAFAVGAQRRLARIAEQTTFFKDGDEVLAGVAARATFGHTPGHMSFEVREGSETVMILGDSIGNHHVAFEQPTWLSGSDQDGETAMKTRLSLLDQLSSEKTRIIGFHLPQGGTGYVDKAAGAYVFVPEQGS
jgi:glyoxylase-like metal-dependent hydrolase (beta-lactamase superfamily II)